MATTLTESPSAVRRPRRRTLTPQEFLDLEARDGTEYELDGDGHLRRRQMGQESDEVSNQFIAAFTSYAVGRGRVIGGGTGLQIFPDRPRRIPRADAGYISRTRLPHSVKGLLQVAPELLVEVVSPGDNAAELALKVDEYLSVGVVRVWVAYPDQRSITVYRPDGTATVLKADDEITGEAAMPGFRCKVADFFPE